MSRYPLSPPPHWMKRLMILWVWAVLTPACSEPPSRHASSPPTVETQSQGIVKVTRGGRDFLRPNDTPAGKTWLYQISLPFQVDRDKAAAFCNVREGLVKGVDFECGVDVILFNNLSNLNSDDAVIVTRNQEEPNPHSIPSGKSSVVVKYPALGGFVPLEAKRNDGAPHPHAGTGFGINQAIARKVDDPGIPPYGVNMFSGPETYQYFEVHEFAYDGKSFKVAANETFVMPPTPKSGAYLEEVISGGEAIPIWNF
jgi:hypothetical protein